MQATASPSLASRQLQRLVHDRASADAAAALARATGAAEITAFDAVRHIPAWVRELREVASLWPDTGACTIATAFELWLTSAAFVEDADELTDVLSPLLAGRALILEAVTDCSQLRRDLSFIYAAQSAAQAGGACAEAVFGARRHLGWDAAGCSTCYGGDQIDDLEAVMLGFASAARIATDVVETDGAHAAKRGPCANFNGVEDFMRIRNRLDACLTGVRAAQQRAASALAAEVRA